MLRVLLVIVVLWSTAVAAVAQGAGAPAEGDRLQPLGVIWSDTVVTAVAVSSQPDIVAVGSADKTVLYYKLEQGRVLEGYKGSTTVVSFSPDGHMLAVGAEDGRMRVWYVSAGVPIVVSDGRAGPGAAGANAAATNDAPAASPRGAVRALAWSPDGTKIAAAWADGGNAIITVKAATGDAAAATANAVVAQPGADAPVPTLSLAWPSANVLRGIGAGRRKGAKPEGKSDSATYFFSEAVGTECNPLLCRNFEEDGAFMVELAQRQPFMAFVAAHENLMRLNSALDPNLQTEERQGLFIDLPASGKVQPEAASAASAFRDIVSSQKTILDIAFRPRHSQVMTLSPRLVSLWSTQTGAYRYAHVLGIDAHLGGFSPQGDMLFLAGKVEAPNDQGQTTTRQCVGFFKILDTAGQPPRAAGATSTVRYRVFGPEGSEGVGIIGSYTGAGETVVPIPPDVQLPWETTVSIARDAIFNRHIPLQLSARAFPQPSVRLNVEIYVDGNRIGDAAGFAPKAQVQKH